MRIVGSIYRTLLFRIKYLLYAYYTDHVSGPISAMGLINYVNVSLYVRTVTFQNVCRSSVLSGRNVRWPRRMLPTGESR